MFVADYHVHSNFSGDGKNSVEENVQSAIKKGLKEMAVTEHAYSNLNGIKKGSFSNILEEVDRLRKKYPEIKILKGIEMNLLDDRGNVDISLEEQSKLDFVVLGCHRECSFFKYWFRHKLMQRKTKKQIERNTDAYIKAIENNRVDILAHLYYANVFVDIKRIAECAAKNNILIELNGKRIYFKKEDVKILLDAGVFFVANSDSHKKENVGNNSRAYSFAVKYGIPFERIVNWNNVVSFKAKSKEGK